MAGFVRRWTAAFVLGGVIWLLSFPLVASVPRLVPVAAEAMPAERGDTHSAKPAALPLVLGQRAAPPAVAPGALRPPLIDPDGAANPSVPDLPAGKANWLSIARLGLNQPVGWYTDCHGQAPVPRWGTWRWKCAGANNTYILAHNPGVFTPILGLRLGDTVRYGDPGGTVRAYRVTMTTIVGNTQLWPLDATSAPSLTLQTCWTWDGSRDFIVRAIQL